MKMFGSWSELLTLVFRKNSQAITFRPNQATTYTASRDLQSPPGDADHVLVSASSTSTMSNKTLDNSTVATLQDSNFTLQDNGDNTKQFKLELSGITTGTTRTLTAPNVSSTIAVLDPGGTGQTVSHSTLDSTNTATFKDANFSFVDDGDITKVMQFQLSGLTTGTTRTITIPDASTTMVGTDVSQTLTNKSISGSTNTISNINLASQVTGTLPIGNGGTGQTAKTAGFDALSPLSTKGDLLGFDGTHNVRFPVGTDGFVLSADSTQTDGIKWVNPSTTPPDGVVARNLLLNANFALWQRGTSATAANGLTKYQADRWFIKNSLGTNGVLTLSQTAAVTNGSTFGAKVQITTAPTAAQVNGTELYQIVENPKTLQLFGKSLSFSILVKALGNVNQVGVQLLYATTETIPSSNLGTETAVTVNTSTFTSCSTLNIAVSNTPTSTGVVGVRIRVTGVSSGNLYDLNNGFVVEQAMLNIGATASSFAVAENSVAAELIACQRYYQTNYAIDYSTGSAAPGITSGNWVVTIGTGDNNSAGGVMFPVKMRATPGTITIYSPNTGTSGKAYNNLSADVSVSASNYGQSGIGYLNNGAGAISSDRLVAWMYTADAEI